jgi:hypothetical protein
VHTNFLLVYIVYTGSTSQPVEQMLQQLGLTGDSACRLLASQKQLSGNPNPKLIIAKH